MPISTPDLTPALPGVDHHHAEVNGVRLHYVAAGSTGSPILLVHGWPETWWAFRGLLPLLARTHRVFALDLRGFGSSGSSADADYSEAAFAQDLHELVEHLGVGPVHLLCQDISGGPASAFAAEHPDDVLSFTGVETSFAGFGLELLADVNHGGSWHVGFLGTPGIPQLLLPGHERDLVEWAYRVFGATPEHVTATDIDVFVQAYTGPDAWHGSAGLYGALLTDGGRTSSRAAAHPLRMPVLAVDGPNAPFTADSLRGITAVEPTSAVIEGVGHLVAQEAPERLAEVLLRFVAGVDRTGARAEAAQA